LGLHKCQQTRKVGVVAEKNKYVKEIHFLHMNFNLQKTYLIVTLLAVF